MRLHSNLSDSSCSQLFLSLQKKPHMQMVPEPNFLLKFQHVSKHEMQIFSLFTLQNFRYKIYATKESTFYEQDEQCRL